MTGERVTGERRAGWRVSWVRVYRLALRLLPGGLHQKHGAAMEQLFAQELERVGASGWRARLGVGVAGVCDVIRRATYERLRDHTGAEAADHADAGGAQMPLPTSGQLLRRLAGLFSFAFVTSTAAMLFLSARHWVPRMRGMGASSGEIVELLALSVPFTAAMSIPMAVLLSVLGAFTRLGRNGTLAAAGRVRGGVRRLMVPVLAASLGVAALALVVTVEIVPRTNTRISEVLTGRPNANDRTMTIAELRSAAQEARMIGEPGALAHAAAYDVELHKKLALPAACVVFALVGMTLPLRFPRGGHGLMLVASLVVLIGYYLTLTTGETLADRMMVSPMVAMWGANALLFTTALVTVWRRRGTNQRASMEGV